MEYKFPTECCNLPTNLVLSAIYCQVVGAAEISTAQSTGCSPRYRGEGAEAAGQHMVQLGRTVTISCWHQRVLWGLWKGAAPMAGTKETLGNHTLGNITTGMSYFKDMSALKMPNPSSHFEVFLWDVFAHTHTHATNKPSNSRLYGSFLNPVQSVDRESHSPFLRKRSNSYKEQSENETPPFFTMVTHRRQDGDPLVYHRIT